MSALWVACFLNHTDHALILADHVDASFEQGCMTPLYWAAKHGNVPLVKKLLARGANDHSALYIALRFGHDEVSRLLLDHGLFCADAPLHVSPEIRVKMKTIEQFKTYAVLRPDLLVAQLRAGRSAPFRQWLHQIDPGSFESFFAFLVLSQRVEASCFAALFFTDSDAPVRRLTCTGSPVSELLVRYLVLPKPARLTLREIRAYLQ